MQFLETNQELVGLMKEILTCRYSDVQQMQRLSLILRKRAKECGSCYSLCFAEYYLLEYAARFQSHKKARTQLQHTLNVCETTDYNSYLLMTYNLAGMIFMQSEEYLSALQFYGNVISMGEESQDYDDVAAAWINLCNLFVRLEQFDTALSYCRLAQAALRKVKKSNRKQELTNRLQLDQAAAYLHTGHAQKALSLLDKCSLSIDGNVISDVRMIKKTLMAQIYFGLGRREEAVLLIDEALSSQLDENCGRDVIWHMLFTFAEMALELGDRDRTVRMMQLLDNQKNEDTAQQTLMHIAQLHAQYNRQFGTKEEQLAAYETYFMLREKNRPDEKRAIAQSIDSRLKLQSIARENQRIRTNNATLRNISAHDELTGMPNRRKLNAELDRRWNKAVHTGQTIGILVFDIDRFKEFNDTCGHLFGDELLRAAAQSLKDDSGTFYAARFGGDEFVAICTDCTDLEIEAYIECVFQRMRAIQKQTNFELPPVTLSAGYYNRPAQKNMPVQQLIEYADSALYTAKKKRRNCFCAYRGNELCG